MILLFTDFGYSGPYVGQMKAAIAAVAPDLPVIDLMHDAPAFDARASAYLLAALTRSLGNGVVVLAVVDPGVGGARRPIILEAGGTVFVGPENGLLSIVARRADCATASEILWRPDYLSRTFHGRDLFAPVAARIASGAKLETRPVPLDEVDRPDWPEDLAEIIYFDGFGNAMTGIRAEALPAGAHLEVAGRRLPHADTFSDVASGAAFWYENSNGLAEIAVNCGRADGLGLSRGIPVTIPETP